MLKKIKKKNENGRNNKNYIINMIVLSINEIEKNKYNFLSIFKRAFNYLSCFIIENQ